MANTGDKFVIEIDKVFFDDSGQRLYRIKGFNSLVFDDHGIEKLMPYKDQEKRTKCWIECGMLFAQKDNPDIRVVVTHIDDNDKYFDSVDFVECQTGKVGSYPVEMFKQKYVCTRKSVYPSLQVVLGELPS